MTFGIFAERWQHVKLESVCEYITVGYVGSMTQEYVEDGIPFLRSQNIQPFNLDLNNMKYISPDFHNSINKSALQPGDVAIVRTGYPGTACVIPPSLPESNCADLVIARPSSKLHPYFLAALLNSAWGKGSVAGRLVGVAQQHFNVTAAKSLKIPVPPLETQRRIAHVLSAYDDLIENNTWRIRLLEQAVHDLYHEWFVEFRFRGHEGVEMVDSELGQIPQGWGIMVVSEAIDINPRMKLDKERENHFISMGRLSESGMVIDTTEMEFRTGNSGAKFINGDTLLARITPSLENGKTAYVQFLPEGAIGRGSTEFIVMRSKTVTPEWVYCLARVPEFRLAAEKTMTGASGRQRIQNEFFDNYKIAHPDHKILREFSQIVKPNFDGIFNLTQRNEILRETRDLLLPRLVSGQLDVSAIELPEDEYAD